MEKNHSNQSSLVVSTDDADDEKKSPPIVIKFKMNMAAAAAADDTKEFSCGKALGGHIRSHISSNNNNNNNNNNVVLDSTTTPTSEDQKAACSICGKGFRSNKAFYGHLRLHPEREWRGVHPPPPPPHKNTHSTSSSSSYVSDEYTHQTIDQKPQQLQYRNIDLLKCVSSWTVKDKRGRKRKQAKPPEEPKREVEGVDEYIERICQELAEMKKKTLEEKENQPAAMVVEEQKYKYKCVECNRSFSSHQALGGHRSSHNRYKDSNPPPHTAHVNAATSTSASASASILVTIAKEENNTKAASTKVEDGGQLIDQRILGFDLNEPAVQNDDDE